jgi:butyryl-CoA dehydrogenase
MIREHPARLRAGAPGPLRRRMGPNHTFPAEALKELGRPRRLGMVVPEEWEGAGMDYMSLVLISRRSPPATAPPQPSSRVQNSLACGITMKYGTHAQKENTWGRWPVANGSAASA